MKKFAILCGAVMFASSAMAAEQAPEGDAERGQELATPCAACHGADGNSPTGDFPSIAGQHPKYIVKQLMDYKSGARENALMVGQVAALSEQDMRDLAAYFSAQENTIVGTNLEDADLTEAQRLFLGGDEDRGITACAACHGPRATGMGLAGFPLLSGQHAQYTDAMLKAFRSGERDNDPNGMMRDIAVRLTDRDIELLSDYISGLY